MPKLIIENGPAVEVPEGKRLILAITDEAGVDALHACGGNARCTTCRVEFVSGEPSRWTKAEKEILQARGITSGRLSCQIQCEGDMTVRVLNHLKTSGRPDAGKRPTDAIAPPPEWVS
ncbi:(2Fe-2S)-binding protein [Telmatocola sphagniphila]|jgi:ferredoxin|uniref:(2Fe-2S)-binding protein n=1 Tax=Telmatocola sphagniphila TaxID=1123043 RepID=A0A8E6EX27_9BACT|nr:2Fe-2S iron-sulfur cluster-binding protein [Telmatocola sphagniphila]QVL34432.1 (2Fe-2S)-binding protein [Telmatocola sphagniphila]